MWLGINPSHFIVGAADFSAVPINGKNIPQNGKEFLCATVIASMKTGMEVAHGDRYRGTVNVSAADGLKKKPNGWKPNAQTRRGKMLDRITAAVCLFAALFIAVQVGIGIGRGMW